MIRHIMQTGIIAIARRILLVVYAIHKQYPMPITIAVAIGKTKNKTIHLVRSSILKLFPVLDGRAQQVYGPIVERFVYPVSQLRPGLHDFFRAIVTMDNTVNETDGSGFCMRYSQTRFVFVRQVSFSMRK